MRKLALAAALGLVATAASAEGISGIFQTQKNDNGDVGMVQFGPCGDLWCGKLVKSFHADGKEFRSENTGRAIVANMKSDGGGAFSGGTIWDPGSGKTYKSTMQLSGRTLTVKGCVAVFCRSQTWTRVK